MKSRSTESGTDLKHDITQAHTLTALLGLLGDAIERLAAVDGYLINLRDADCEFLVTQKLRLTEEFRPLEDTYYHYKIALAGDALNLNTRAFHGREIALCDIDTATELERAMLRAWKLQQFAAIAILDDDNFDEAPLGTLLLLKQSGHIEEAVFADIEDLIAQFYQPLKTALEASYEQADREQLASATLDHARFLHFVVELNNLTSTDTIYPTFATEMFRQFAFDGIGFFLQENGMLVNKHVEVADPHYEQRGKAWQDFLRETPYELQAADGGISHAFVKKQPLLFHDVQAIIGLPMTEKDRQSLHILQSARTLLLVPFFNGGKECGVLAFYSLQDAVDISETDLRMIGKLADCFGAAIGKIAAHRAA